MTGVNLFGRAAFTVELELVLCRHKIIPVFLMLGDTTSIFFQTELRFIPFEERSFGKSFVRELYSQLAKPGGYAYEDLSLQANPPTMVTKRVTQHGTGRSMCRVSADAILIEETEPEGSENEFIEIVGTVLKAVAEVKKDCPPIFGQKCSIQCVAKPLKSKHSIELLAGKVSNVLDGGAIGPFERPPQFFGVRFRFPPIEFIDEDEDEDDKAGREVASQVGESAFKGGEDFVTVRFETWSKDVDQVWMEITAMNFFQDPIDVADSDRISRHIKEAYQFITEKCVKFLSQFDDREIPTIEEDEKEE